MEKGQRRTATAKAAVETERVLPHSLDAEQALLGGLLLDNEALYRLPVDFSADDFFLDQHRVIFQAIARVLDAGHPADAVSVHNALVAATEQERAGGLSYLNALAVNTPSAANVSNYARIIREHAQLRRIIRASEESLAIAWRPGSRSPRAVLDEIEARVLEVSEGQGRGDDFADGRALMDATLQWVVDAQEGRRRGLSTGLADLDSQLGVGLEPGALVIVGGRPSSGKTALALNVALAVAEQGRAAAVFSMEMGLAQLGLRLAAGAAQIDHGALRKGHLSDDEYPRLVEAGERIAALPLHINETGGLHIDQIRARARRLARRSQNLGLIVVDYLQLMDLDIDAETNAIALGEVTKALKALAKELQVTVVCLSQLNRKLEERLDKRPVMSDLRQSGSIEQDADVIVFVHREEQYNPETPNKGVAELIVAKNRDGEVGTVHAAFRGRYSRFENLARL